MSQRERWIVYPLLFLALGIAVRDKLIPPERLDVGLLRCDQLEVLDRVACQQLAVCDPQGIPRLALDAAADGQLSLVDRQGQTILILGADETGQRYGLFSVRGNGRLSPLTLYTMPTMDSAEGERGKSERADVPRVLEGAPDPVGDR